MKVTLPTAAASIIATVTRLLHQQWYGDSQGEAEEPTSEDFCRDFSLSTVVQ